MTDEVITTAYVTVHDRAVFIWKSIWAWNLLKNLNLDLPADLFLPEFPLFLGDPDQSKNISD